MDASSILNTISFSAVILTVLLLVLTKIWRAAPYNKSNVKFVPAAAGGLPIIGHLHHLGGKKPLAITISEMADKYGAVFSLRLGLHPTVIISDHKAMKECFTINDKILAYRPPSSQAQIIGYNYAAFGFSPYGSYWRNMRKLATIELLSSQRIKLLNNVQVSEVNHLVKDIYLECNNRTSEKINMSERIENMVLNMVTRMVASKRFIDCGGEDEKVHPLKQIMRDFVFVPGDLIPFIGWLDVKGVVKTMKRVTEEVDSIVESWIEEHKLKKNENEDRKDFIDVMLSVIEDDDSLGLKKETIIKATITAIVIAASDTTAITTIWALCNLLNNRNAMERAQEELDQKIGKNRCVQVDDIEKLEYLRAVVKETLRLYPAAPLGVPRQAAEDCYISEYFIPKGTRLFTNFWKLHRDPNIWSNPDEFIPERFLTKQSYLDVSGQNFEYLPFSGGRRSCPGTNLAMQIIHLSLARLIQAFDITTPGNEAVDMTEGEGIILPKKAPLQVVLTPRLAHPLYDQD
ncbi:cytochrome P450 CYP82J17-like [Euphorbia lathyris]|uniref:cytochrome P450 CYP82J17-like n=1 Tax=Euphorbia lathyris TaxID=212925 RepID=UPI0033132641